MGPEENRTTRPMIGAPNLRRVTPPPNRPEEIKPEEITVQPQPTEPAGTDEDLNYNVPILTEPPPLEEAALYPPLIPGPKQKKHYETPYPMPENLAWKLGGSNLYRRFGWHWLMRENPENVARREMADQADTFWALLNSADLHRIIAFFNSKGGAGKTSAASGLLGEFAYMSRLNAVGVDGNKATGHLAQRFGMELNKSGEGDARNGTITLMNYLDKVHAKDLLTYARLKQYALTHPETGAMVIGTDPPKNFELTQVRFREGMYNLLKPDGNKFEGIAHSVFIDTGNDFSSPSNIGAAQVADRFVMVGRADDDETLADLGSTMDLLREVTPYASLKPLGEKVDRAIIVIVGAEENTLSLYADRYRVDLDQVFHLPMNPYIGSKSSSPLELRKLPNTARVALRKILIALYDDSYIPRTSTMSEEVLEASLAR